MPFQISLEGSLDVISNLNKKNNNFPPEREYLGWKRSGWPPLAWIPRRVVHLRVKVLGGTPSPPSFSSSLSLFPLVSLFLPSPLLFFLLHAQEGIYPSRLCVRAFVFFFSFFTQESRWQNSTDSFYNFSRFIIIYFYIFLDL